MVNSGIVLLSAFLLSYYLQYFKSGTSGHLTQTLGDSFLLLFLTEECFAFFYFVLVFISTFIFPLRCLCPRFKKRKCLTEKDIYMYSFDILKCWYFITVSSRLTRVHSTKWRAEISVLLFCARYFLIALLHLTWVQWGVFLCFMLF